MRWKLMGLVYRQLWQIPIVDHTNPNSELVGSAHCLSLVGFLASLIWLLNFWWFFFLFLNLLLFCSNLYPSFAYFQGNSFSRFPTLHRNAGVFLFSPLTWLAASPLYQAATPSHVLVVLLSTLQLVCCFFYPAHHLYWKNWLTKRIGKTYCFANACSILCVLLTLF